ncbi:anti-sigma factor family protein [Ekhidna sp.]|uniref:anti-sigma factor family protein n=1 Tax=Ekhidna sp. TaxID=2608089 RepID=UPI003CCB8A55
MSNKPEESKLIAYLYGELNEVERREVEDYLSGNKDAQSELHELRSTLGIIRNLEDKEVEVPAFTFQNAKNVIAVGHEGKWWRIPLSIAASIALIMTAAYFTDFRFSSGESGIQIAFGKIEEAKDERFTKSEVDQMITIALENNNQLINQKLEQTKSDLIAEAGTYEPAVDQRLLNDYIDRLRRYNAETIGGLLEESETEQRRYTDQVIQDLAIFMDLQRQDDMEIIQARIENLSEDTERFNRQTGQILTSLLSDETQNDNQY